MAAHQDRGRGRLDRRPARPGSPQPPRGRDGHPSRRLTVVHDGGSRLDAVGLWLSTPRAVHLGDQVGWPRGGLAPSGTYAVRLERGGFLSVVAGTLTGWSDLPGPGPVLTPSGELDETPAPTTAGNVVPLRRPPASDGTTGTRGEASPTCPCRRVVGLRLADEQDEQRERERARRERVAEQAVTAARALLLSTVLDDGGVDVGPLVAGMRAAMDGDLAIGPFAQQVVTGLPAEVMVSVLRLLLQACAPVGAGRPEGPGHQPVDFRVTYRVLAQRALAVHGEVVLDALPARLVADGMGAEAIVRPRLERLLGRQLPGELGRLARRSLHGLDEPLGGVDPRSVEIALMAIGVVD